MHEMMLVVLSRYRPKTDKDVMLLIEGAVPEYPDEEFYLISRPASCTIDAQIIEANAQDSEFDEYLEWPSCPVMKQYTDSRVYVEDEEWQS